MLRDAGIGLDARKQEEMVREIEAAVRVKPITDAHILFVCSRSAIVRSHRVTGFFFMASCRAVWALL